MNYPNRDYRLHLSAHSHTGLGDGPGLIVLGAVHGNETCGTLAIRQVLAAIESGDIVIRRGSVTFIPVANPLAFRQGSREGERNLNRRLYPTDSPEDFEDQVANWLCPLLARHDVLLDLHSFHTPGDPFVMLGPENNAGPLEPFSRAPEERALAQHLGIRRFVDGWLDTYARGVARRRESLNPAVTPTSLATDPRFGVGTTEYMRTTGGYGVTVECGQHDDPAAIGIAHRAILNTLAFLGLTDDPPPEPVPNPDCMRIRNVVDKIDTADTFVREWDSFDRLRPGDRVGMRGDGSAVIAEREGYILFPNPAAEGGQEWFYVAEPVDRPADDDMLR